MARLLGSKNKIPQSVKENIQIVFAKLGGTASMSKWAEENQTEFYKIYARLLPVEGPGENGAHLFELKAPWLTAKIASRNG